MSAIHLFFPQNDLALARDLANFTPPPAAWRLAQSGATLPLWYADPGDRFICSGVNEEWLRNMQRTFGIDVEPFWPPVSEGETPCPWGWSKAARRAMTLAGVDAGLMPSDAALARIREISHRRTASLVAAQLAGRLSYPIPAPAAELHSYAEAEAYVAALGPTMLKLPWSSSGRGNIPVNAADLASRRQAIEGGIRRYGSIMAEERLDKTLDFAALFTRTPDGCRFDGFSVFGTTPTGAYTSNILASDTHLLDIIGAHCPADQVESAVEALAPILHSALDGYTGPLGVDMMACRRDGAAALAPVVEINLRNTMGHVARRFADRYMHPSATGTLSVVPAVPSAPPGTWRAFDGRLTAGTLPLTPPATPFTITAAINF